MMKKRLTILIALTMMGTMSIIGCSSKSVTKTAIVSESVSEDDQTAADQVAALIDAIYVQQRTADTDAQCQAAKEGWDALTDSQKLLVQGDNADPDYFGRDTGDSALDDSRNQDEIGENELLVVSFGTSYNDSRVADIKGIEDALQKAYPDWYVRRAFTAQIIINHVQARDGEYIDNVDQALKRAISNGVKNLIVQPTHLMHGAEYDELLETLDNYKAQFESVRVAEPLLGEADTNVSVVNADKKAVAEIIAGYAVKDADYKDLQSAKEDGTAFVILGHGTSHTAKVTYTQMQEQMNVLGYDNIFIGTVEGEPEETSFDAVLEKATTAGYKKIILRPLMVVAGDHANNDMAGEDESWQQMFMDSEKFESVSSQIVGLGRIPEVQDLYVAHTLAVMEKKPLADVGINNNNEVLEDGRYLADFHTDSGMFHANEACDGKGVLAVENGKMTFHVSLASQNILNLYLGLAADADQDGAVLLEPTLDTVTYNDGTTEEVNGFDIPVSALNVEFNLALIGTKGKWYDHKVSVSNPVKIEEMSDTQSSKNTTNKLDEDNYLLAVILEGGSGRASVTSPTKLAMKDGKMIATIEWSSSNYDYMIVDGQKYLPVNDKGNSVFEIPVRALDEKLTVIADTVAMGTPHEIEYTLTFDSQSVEKE